MTIAIFSNINSIWTREYISNVLDKKDNILVISPEDRRDKPEDIGITLLEYNTSGPFIQRFISYKRILNKVIDENPDFIQFNYVDWSILIKSYAILRKRSKIIMTFWGSDVLRASKIMFLIYRPYLKRAVSINMLTQNMVDCFIDYFGHKFDSKLTCFDFGCPMYEEIDFIRNREKEEYKLDFGIDKDQIVVAVGYSGIPEQQHNKIINAIKEIKDEKKKNVTLLIHFGYARKLGFDYLSEVKDNLKTCGFNYVVIDHFLEKSEIAKLRIITDLFLYAQTTDALAASFVEFLYSGTVVTKPIWLQYHELDDIGVKYIEYNDFKELKVVFEDIIDNIEYYKSRVADNTEKLRALNSWEVVAPKWKKIYLNGE